MRWFKKSTKRGCEYDGVCDCGKIKEPTCKDCQWYRFLDNGYGRCSAVPEAPIIPWCKFSCWYFIKSPKA